MVGEYTGVYVVEVGRPSFGVKVGVCFLIGKARLTYSYASFDRRDTVTQVIFIPFLQRCFRATVAYHLLNRSIINLCAFKRLAG